MTQAEPTVGWGSRAFYRFGRFVVSSTTRVYTRMSIDGRDRLPEGAFVLAPVHRSYIDTPISGCVTKRRLRFMGKDSMWKYAWFGKILTALGSFPGQAGHCRPRSAEAVHRGARRR